MANSVFLIGNLAADPVLSETQGGTAKGTFRLAVSNRPKEDGTPRDPDYIWVKCWNGTATAVCKHLGKGSEIAVVNGQIKTRSVKKDDGSYDNYFEVNVSPQSQIKFLRRPNGQTVDQDVTAVTADPDAPTAPHTDSDIPF